jgi:hypothetical protein
MEPSENKEAAKPAEEKPAAAKPAAAKPAAAKAAPKKKEAPPKEPLADNGDGTITDPNTGLMWKKADAWNDMHVFYTWDKHTEYVNKVNKEKFAGHDDWRIPDKKEAATLIQKDKEVMDKNGIPYPLDPIFEEGGVSNTWISECSDEQIIRFDFKTGVDTPYPTSDVWASMRLVRKTS